MNTGRFWIDKVDASNDFGVCLCAGSFAFLLSYPQLKEPDFNDWAEEDGIEVDLSNPKLDTRTLTLNFSTFGQDPDWEGFITLLSGSKSYHTFTFDDLSGEKFILRLNQSTEFKVEGLVQFTLEFSDDTPLPNYTYKPPVSFIDTKTEYGLDGRWLSDYGLRMNSGTMAELLKPSQVKKRQLFTNKVITGVIYDDAPVKFTQKQVVLPCSIQAGTMVEFLHNYKALLYDLTRPGVHTLTKPDDKKSWGFYYQQATIENFSYSGGVVLCVMKLTLQITSYK